MERHIQSVIDNHALWQYYEYGPTQPDINDIDSCYRFIGDYFRQAQKYSSEVEDGLHCLLHNNPQRLQHVVSTFFLGIALYHDENLSFRQCISEQLRRFQVFRNADIEELDRQFEYIWFMITLFHDLGYLYENNHRQFNAELYCHEIAFCNSVPYRYRDVIRPYQQYRENKDHGICAGLILDKVLCETRKSRCYLGGSPLNWAPRLDEVYHHVAWMIMAHNIWWKRDTCPTEELEQYHEVGLGNLVLSSKRLKSGTFCSYPIRYGFHPIFFLFCLVDSIEPIKRLHTLQGVELNTERSRINLRVESDADIYVNYLRKDIVGMNDWLIHVRCDTMTSQASIHIPHFHFSSQ